MKPLARSVGSWAVVLTALVLAACGGQPQAPQFQPEFTTRSTDNGIRLFKYSTVLPKRYWPKQQQVKPILLPPEYGVPTQQPQRQRNALKDFRAYMAQDPALKRYCPHGQRLLELSILFGELTVRGECKTAAEAAEALDK